MWECGRKCPADSARKRAYFPGKSSLRWGAKILTSIEWFQMAPFHNANHLVERAVIGALQYVLCVDGNYWAVYTGRGFLFSSLGTWGHAKASRSPQQDAGQHERRGCFSNCVSSVTTATITINCKSANASPLRTTRDRCGPYSDLWTRPSSPLFGTAVKINERVCLRG